MVGMTGTDDSEQKKNLQERIRNLEEEINPPEKGRKSDFTSQYGLANGG